MSGVVSGVGNGGNSTSSGETDSEEGIGSHASEGCREDSPCSVHQVRYMQS